MAPSLARARPQFDRIGATCAALVILGLTVFLLVRNQPIADARLFLALRVILGFAAALLGATIPGFLNIGWKGNGLALRAGGALALFVLTYAYTPDLATEAPAGGQSATSVIGAPCGVTTGGNATGNQVDCSTRPGPRVP